VYRSTLGSRATEKKQADLFGHALEAHRVRVADRVFEGPGVHLHALLRRVYLRLHRAYGLLRGGPTGVTRVVHRLIGAVGCRV